MDESRTEKLNSADLPFGKPIASRVLMVRPLSFRSNEETLETNAFQSLLVAPENATQLARAEFDRLRSALIHQGIQVETFDEPHGANTPDAIFPNNWFASLPDGHAYLFPMMANNRRREVYANWVHQVLPNAPVTDLRAFENDAVFLEGTGSLILDHKNRVGYACYSRRTQKKAIEDFARRSRYEILGFDAVDLNGAEYYHTNVIMALGSNLAILCVEAMTSLSERKRVLDRLAQTGHEVLPITRAQVNEFSGNMIELANQSGKRFGFAQTEPGTLLRPSRKLKLRRMRRLFAKLSRQLKHSAEAERAA